MLYVARHSIFCFVLLINVRGTERENQEWTIHRLWQYWADKTQDEKKPNNNKKQRRLKRWVTQTHPKTRGMDTGAREGFLLLIRNPPCYPYSRRTPLIKQTTQIRHKPTNNWLEWFDSFSFFLHIGCKFQYLGRCWTNVFISPDRGYIIYVICVYLRIVVSNTYYVLFVFVLCAICCQFLWIVHCYCPLGILYRLFVIIWCPSSVWNFFSHTNLQQYCSPVQNQNLHGWLYGRGDSNEVNSPWSNRIGKSLHKEPVLLTTPHLGISFYTPNNIRIPRCSVYRKWGVPLKMLTCLGAIQQDIQNRLRSLMP